MCKLVVRSGFYEELSVPTPHLRNAHFFITRLYKIGQKPKFRQCYFLGNIKNIKIYILGHILVPVSEDPGEAAGYRPVAAPLKHMYIPVLVMDVRYVLRSMGYNALRCQAY